MDTLDLHFPAAGVDVSQAVGRQPNRPAVDGQYARTSPRGVNVRTYDAHGRARGGIRPGIEKFLAARPGNTRYATQDLNVLVTTGTSPVQPSQSGRKVMLVAVSQGVVYYIRAGETSWSTATNNTAETPPLNATGLVRSAALNQKLFYADGTNWCYFDGVTGTVETWAASAGSLPADSSSNTPRLICTWRGRIVLSGLLLDPAAIFMTKVSSPTDFNYAPAVPVPADSAWSGATGPQGKMGDVVTGLVPYTDDLLMVGMDSSMAIFRGDPMAGGQIDNVTTTVGMAWGEAWCMDPEGVIYFFSNRTGIFAVRPGQLPVRISTAIDSLLLDIDTGEYGVRLLWNDRMKGLHVFVTLLASPLATTHYFWERSANAFWQDTFVNTDHNPLCCVIFDGNEAADRVALIGSFDGYIRSVSSTATTDDGSDIESEVWIGSFLTKFNDSVLLKEVQGVLGASSADVDYDIFVGDTAEEAIASTPVSSGTWAAGRNYTDAVRRAAYASYVKLSSVGAWALENIRAVVDTQGQVRQRGK